MDIKLSFVDTPFKIESFKNANTSIRGKTIKLAQNDMGVSYLKIFRIVGVFSDGQHHRSLCFNDRKVMLNAYYEKMII